MTGIGDGTLQDLTDRERRIQVQLDKAAVQDSLNAMQDSLNALKIELRQVRDAELQLRAQIAERDRDDWRTRYNDLRLATDQVIINLNNCTAIMRDKPFGGTPDRMWLTEQVNILRAALVPKPYPLPESVPHPCEGHGCGGTSMFMLHTQTCVAANRIKHNPPDES